MSSAQLTKFSGVLTVVGLLATITCFADGGGWHFKPGNKDPNRDFHYRLPQQFQDDVLPGQVEKIKLTKADQQQAQSWGLDSSEEKRYLAIMTNRGTQYFKARDLKTHAGDMIVSDNYTPVEVLGINARTDAERRKYAQEQAEQEFQWNAKFLAYNNAYHKTAVTLKDELNLPIIKKFDTTKFSPYSYKPISLKPHDKLMLFVGINDAVRSIISSLMGSITKDPNIQLDVYFVGKNITKTEVQTWAKSQNLIPEMVKDHQITLNFGNDRFSELNTNRKPPVLVLVRGAESHFVDTGRF